jgi:hypothetical protein
MKLSSGGAPRQRKTRATLVWIFVTAGTLVPACDDDKNNGGGAGAAGSGAAGSSGAGAGGSSGTGTGASSGTGAGGASGSGTGGSSSGASGASGTGTGGTPDSSGGSSSGGTSGGGQAGAGGDAGPGSCSQTQTCPMGQQCCAGRCTNLKNDPKSCNGCGTTCTPPNSFCGNGQCARPPCDSGTSCQSGSCCGSHCCAGGQLCCEVYRGGAAIERLCHTPTAAEPTCPLGCTWCF